MKELRCENPHPRKPGLCGAKIKAHASFGAFTVECWRCFGPVTFSFDTEGTEARGLTSSIA